MKRQDLISAVESLNDAENIEHAIEIALDVVRGFCDWYECEFNNIEQELKDLAPYIESVGNAYNMAEKCGADLY